MTRTCFSFNFFFALLLLFFLSLTSSSSPSPSSSSSSSLPRPYLHPQSSTSTTTTSSTSADCCQYLHDRNLLNECLYSFDTIENLQSYKPLSNQQYRIAIVSYSTPNILHYSIYSHGINSLYSQYNGYYFRMFNITNGQYDIIDQRWNKIQIILTSLQTWGSNFDYIIWIDADAIIINYQFYFHNIIQKYINFNIIASAENFEILISNLFTSGGSVNKINSGVLIIKNNIWSINFLLKLWNYTNRTKYADQTVFDFLYEEESILIGKEELEKKIQILPPYVLNSNSPVALWYHDYQPILHLLGEHPEYREYVLKQIFQSICSYHSQRGSGSSSGGGSSTSSSNISTSTSGINNVILNITSQHLANWHLEITYPIYHTMLNSLTIHMESIRSMKKSNPLDQVIQYIDSLHLSSLIGSIIHLSTRLAGVLVFLPSSSSSSSSSSPYTDMMKLSPYEFSHEFMKTSIPPSISFNNADHLLLKTYRTLKLLLNTILRPINQEYSLLTNGHNMTNWYYYLHMTGLLGEFLCSIPIYHEKLSIILEVQELYHELLSYPIPLPVDSPISTRSNQLRSLGLLQYYQLIHLKKKNNPNQLYLQLELQLENNLIESYELYRYLSIKYGSQGLWMMEGMLGIISCELGKTLQADGYFHKAMERMKPSLSEIDFSYGIILKYYADCLIQMNRLDEAENILQQSLIIHSINRIPITHVTYYHLYEIKTKLQQKKQQLMIQQLE